MDKKVSDEIIHTESINNKVAKPSREEAMEAVKTLISWAGDDPSREGLTETPKRVVKAYEEFFAGYEQDALKVLGKTFEDVNGYDDIVFLRDINIDSHCEHHMVPIAGKAHVAYLPKDKVVGISKLARVIEIFSKRLQTQETMTMQIMKTIDEALEPFGTAIMIDAKHQCMTTRGINKPNVSTITTKFSGLFAEDAELRNRFMQLVKE
tara:strand:- start:1961 stop:2584 length:624 start_codon:yes stop_codon:yes gene_type:complete